MSSDTDLLESTGRTTLDDCDGDWRVASAALMDRIAVDPHFAAAAARTWAEWLAQMVLLRATAETRASIEADVEGDE